MIKIKTVGCMAFFRNSIKFTSFLIQSVGRTGHYISLDHSYCEPFIPDEVEDCFAVPAVTLILTSRYDLQLVNFVLGMPHVMNVGSHMVHF